MKFNNNYIFKIENEIFEHRFDLCDLEVNHFNDYYDMFDYYITDNLNLFYKI